MGVPSPPLKIINGLSQYRGQFKDIVFRRGQDSPSFEVETSTLGNTNIVINITRNGTNIARISTEKNVANDRYTGVWDWKFDQTTTIPDQIPVGVYNATADRIATDGSLIAQSEPVEFYVIFDTPESLGVTRKSAYLYDENDIRDEIGVWFKFFEGKDPVNDIWRGEAYGLRYQLAPFSPSIFNNSGPDLNNVEGSIRVVDGQTSATAAAELLAKHVSDSFAANAQFEAGGIKENNKTKAYSTKQMLTQKKAFCAEQANLLTAYLRSVGIAARPVAVDTYSQFGKRWRFHTWTEVWLGGEWKAMDPFITNIFIPSPQRKFGGNSSAPQEYNKSFNDMVIMADPDYINADLDDAYYVDEKTLERMDVVFTYSPRDSNAYFSGVSVPHIKPWDHQASWVADVSDIYWGVSSSAPRDVEDPPIAVQVQTDKAQYQAGETVTITAVINNTRTTDWNSRLNITAYHESSTGSLVIPSGELYSYNQTLTVLANGPTLITTSFPLSESVDTSDNYYVVASFENETNVAFFRVTPGYRLYPLLPAEMNEGITYALSLDIRNTATESLTGIVASVFASPDMLEFTEDPTYTVGTIQPDGNVTLTWHATVVGPNYSGITFEVRSENGGTAYSSSFVPVLQQPTLKIESEHYLTLQPNEKAVDLIFNVSNLGDLQSPDVVVALTVPPNVTASQSQWNVGNLVGGQRVDLTSHITVSEPKDFVIDISGNDTLGNDVSSVVYVAFPG